MKTTIVVLEYPNTFVFETDKPLPEFKYGCPTRTKILREELRSIKYSAPHAIEDFIVEKIEKRKSHEVWIIGS